MKTKYIICLFLLFSFLGLANLYSQPQEQPEADTGSIQTVFYYYTLESINLDKCTIAFGGTGKATFTYNWWSNQSFKKWQTGDLLKLMIIDGEYVLENITFPSSLQIEMMALPVESIRSINKGTVVLNSNWIFKTSDPNSVHNSWWQEEDNVTIFHNFDETYNIYNITNENGIINWQIIGIETPKTHQPELRDLIVQSVRTLEERLNQRVIDQFEATAAVTDAVINYAAGLKNNNSPVGAFLFLGPTGVGKTELAKVLTDELYEDSSHLIRFDMSHFGEHFASTRLFGSPPGYVNHEEGGQLTEKLKENSQCVVLLDEFEKAHPMIAKVFLPVFDEGYIVDAKGVHIDCKESIFILTSNLCSQEISNLSQLGYDSEEILSHIEHKLIDALSPELYSRLTPIVFNPVKLESMGKIVELQLIPVVQQLKDSRNITLSIDDSVKDYLALNGYHPAQGVRTLKRLIDKKVSQTIAKVILLDEVPNDSFIYLSYDELSDKWNVSWSL